MVLAQLGHIPTAPGEVVERLSGATIAITNKVPIRAEALNQLPALRMIAVAATGTDIVDSATCRERGMVVTNNVEYARTIRMLRDWGQSEKYRHALKGFNYRMEAMQGSVLRIKLRRLDEWTDARRAGAPDGSRTGSDRRWH